jgi:hypothetical protein
MSDSSNSPTNVQEHAPSPAAACSAPQPASERPDQSDNKAAGEGRVARLVRFFFSFIGKVVERRKRRLRLRNAGVSASQIRALEAHHEPKHATVEELALLEREIKRAAAASPVAQPNPEHLKTFLWPLPESDRISERTQTDLPH